jgi:hypothetical protein
MALFHVYSPCHFKRKTVHKVETIPDLLHKVKNMRVLHISVEFTSYLLYISYSVMKWDKFILGNLQCMYGISEWAIEQNVLHSKWAFIHYPLYIFIQLLSASTWRWLTSITIAWWAMLLCEDASANQPIYPGQRPDYRSPWFFRVVKR